MLSPHVSLDVVSGNSTEIESSAVKLSDTITLCSCDAGL